MVGLFNTTCIKKEHFIDGDKFEALNSPCERISYLTTDAAIQIIKTGKSPCPAEHLLITHNSDYSISPELIKKLPRHWFAQNVVVNHPQITPLPIGLERVRWFPHLHKRETLIEFMKLKIQPSKLCYANFSLTTNFSQRKSCLNMCSSFSTVAVNNTVNQNSYRIFMEDILNHYFILCPEGNGIDTHRLWETLYLGRIPVVTHNITVESFKDLPILIIPSWDQFSKKTLEKYLTDFQAGKIAYSMDKLNFLYWKNLIWKSKI
jgi:hypothetical protein